jgi:hypothetical protein
VFGLIKVSNPFSHDTTSNAQTDHSFADDRGVPSEHLVSFAQAMDAPAQSLGEVDYRFPAGNAPASADRMEPAPAEPGASSRPGYYPNGYAP